MEKAKAWKVGDKLFASIEEAQKEELQELLKPEFKHDANSAGFIEALLAIVKNKEAIVNILTLKASSHPKARKANGATRKARNPVPQPKDGA